MAGSFYEAVKALLNAAGDAGDAINKLMFGTSGSKVVWPEDKDYGYPRDTGQMLTSPSAIDYLLQIGLARFFDDRSVSWAVVTTNATGVAPTYSTSAGFATGTAIGKDEVNDRITLTFDGAYTSGDYYCQGMVYGSSASHMAPQARAAGTVTCEFFTEPAGTQWGINNLTVTVYVIGVR